MSVETTSKTMRSYLDALVSRADFADYFTDNGLYATKRGERLRGLAVR